MKYPKLPPKSAHAPKESVWCCVICTYQNNMMLNYCEICENNKPDSPQIVSVK